MVAEQWKEIQAEKRMDFLRIVKILNRYYEGKLSSKDTDKSFQFRKELEIENPKSIRVYLKKFGNYEYLVHAEIRKGNPKRIEKDTWIHIDGIKEERDALEKQGILDHPVFQIQGLTDIFDNGAIETKRKNLPK